MPLPTLRPTFGDFAGGLEHAVALATLAYATARSTGLRWLEPTNPVWPTGAYPAGNAEREQRLVLLLQALLNETVCTLDELRREGFPEHVLSRLDTTASAGYGAIPPAASA